jgi:hypothetical protein
VSPLSPEGIVRALQMLDEEYPRDRPLTAQQKDLWQDVLTKLEPGELRAALESIEHDERRPGPLKVLSIVQDARSKGQRPPRAKMPEIGRQVLEKARRDLA